MSKKNILLIQSSARLDGSVTRDLAGSLAHNLGGNVVTRDLANGAPFVNEAWVGANFTDPENRTAEQDEALSGSDALVGELFDAHTIIIAVPIYNFSIPAALKAWIDQIARARKTFRYTENGPVGLLGGRKAYLVVASGGVEEGSAMDFATPYLRHVLGFIGIDDVEVIDASAQMSRGEGAVANARARIEGITAKIAA